MTDSLQYEKCRCPSGTRGHESGACEAPAVTSDHMCQQHCHDRAAIEATAAMPIGKSELSVPVGHRHSASTAYYAAHGGGWIPLPLAETAPVVVVEGIISPERVTEEGTLIRATTDLFDEIALHLGKDWSRVLDFSAEQWEEIIAGYFHKQQYEVVITPRSGDGDRDFIARKHGIGSIKMLGSMKRYGPGHRVPASAARDLLGVVSGDPKASKAVLVGAAVPTRLELIDGEQLQRLLGALKGK
jgi:restriction system protein